MRTTACGHPGWRPDSVRTARREHDRIQVRIEVVQCGAPDAAQHGQLDWNAAGVEVQPQRQNVRVGEAVSYGRERGKHDQYSRNDRLQGFQRNWAVFGGVKEWRIKVTGSWF